MINVATGQQISINELATTMGAVIGNVDAARAHPTRAPATSAIRWPTSARRRRLLGYEPKSALKKGCAGRSSGTAASPESRL